MSMAIHAHGSDAMDWSALSLAGTLLGIVDHG